MLLHVLRPGRCFASGDVALLIAARSATPFAGFLSHTVKPREPAVHAVAVAEHRSSSSPLCRRAHLRAAAGLHVPAEATGAGGLYSGALPDRHLHAVAGTGPLAALKRRSTLSTVPTCHVFSRNRDADLSRRCTWPLFLFPSKHMSSSPFWFHITTLSALLLHLLLFCFTFSSSINIRKSYRFGLCTLTGHLSQKRGAERWISRGFLRG